MRFTSGVFNTPVRLLGLSRTLLPALTKSCALQPPFARGFSFCRSEESRVILVHTLGGAKQGGVAVWFILLERDYFCHFAL